MDFEIGIIGAGVAGLTAAIYGARAGMSVAVFDQSMSGGQPINTPTIENYPGFPSITGPELMEKMKVHASEYTTIREFEKVNDIKAVEGGFRLTTDNQAYKCKAVILACGARHRTLGVPGELDLVGRGVSYCATCDGNFFKERKVLVIGGGSSAATEALFLHGVGAKVGLVHRRDQLRAEKALADTIEQKGIKVHWNRVLRSIEGEDAVKKVVLESTQDGSTEEVECDGVFVAIGVDPNNSLAKALDLELTDEGYVKTDRMMRTSMKAVYCAGDLAGGMRQIISGAAEGAQAAMTATEACGKAYPF